MIDKLWVILEMEADYNFLSKNLINKLLTARGESAGLIP